MPQSGSYYYPAVTSPHLLGAHNGIRLREVTSAPNAIANTAEIYLSESGGTQGLYWINESGTKTAVGSGGGGGGGVANSLSGTLIPATGSITFVDDAAEKSGHLIAQNSHLILTSSQGYIRVSGTLAMPGSDGNYSNTSRSLILGNGEQIGSDVYSGAYLSWTSGNPSVAGNTAVNLVGGGVTLAWTGAAGTLSAQSTDLILSSSATSQVFVSGNLALPVGSKLILDGNNNYFYSPTSSNIFMVVGGQNIWYATSVGQYYYDDKSVYMGNGLDYWQVYNSTGTAFELWSTNVDAGGGTDGKVLWINDGTDDVNFSGSLILNSGQKIDFREGDHYIASNGLAQMNFFVNGVQSFRLQQAVIDLLIPAMAATQLNIRDDVPLSFGGTYAGYDYWQVYNSTGTAFELWSTDVDAGGGTDGKVLWIEDGTDDVNFSGGINLNINERLTFDNNADANNYIVGNDTSISLYVEGSLIDNHLFAGTYYSTRRILIDDKTLGLGTGEDYKLNYNSTSTRFELLDISSNKILWINDGTDDVNFSGSLKLNLTQRITFDGDEDGDTYIVGAATDNIDVYTGGTFVTRFSAIGGMIMQDNREIYYGGGLDYWQTYNSTGTAFELWSTDVDAGGGTDGKILWINDGTDDVNFSGSLKLNYNERMYFGTNEYITSAAAGSIRFYASGLNPLLMGANYLTFLDNNYSVWGTSNDYKMRYNTTTTELELTDISNNKILWINDGTDDVNFSGSLYLNAGQKIVFDSDGFANDYISSDGASTDIVANGTIALRFNANGPVLLDSRQFQFGTGLDQSLTYTDGTGVVWNDGTNNVITIPDDSNVVSMSGNLEMLGQAYGREFVLQPTGSNPSVSIDWNSGSMQTLILASASLAVSASFVNAKPGASYALIVVQNDAPIDVSWPAAVKWENGSTPTVTAVAAAEDVFSFIVRSESQVYGTQGSNFA